MPTRRKYKSGGRVPSEDISVPDDPHVTAPPHAAPGGGGDDDPLGAALQATKRAVELQRQAQQQPQQPLSIDQRIDQMPGLTPHKRALLKQYPAVVADPAVGAMFNRHYQDGLRRGLRDDSPELDEHIVTSVVREIEHQRALTSADAKPTPENVARREAVHDAAGELSRDAAAFLAEEPAAQPAPALAPRRSIPVSAPVSREVPMSSTTSERRRADMTLSKDEVDIAHASFPSMSAQEAELAYLRNRARMREMQLDGRLPPEGR